MTAANKMTAAGRKEQILFKATQLFAKYGFDKVTVSALAGECNVSEPALYRYFKSKNQLYQEVLEALKDKVDISSLKKELSQMDDIEEILYTFTERLLTMYLNNPEIARLLLYCSLEGHSQSKNVFEVIRVPYIDLLKSIFAKLKRQGLIQNIHPELTARCFTGMVTECAIGANLWKKFRGATFKPNKIMSNTIPIFARGLKK